MSIVGDGLQERGDLGVLNDFSGDASILIEVGFISNANDVKLMTTKTDEISKQIATGIYQSVNGSSPPNEQQK
jgi:N-acetylmuramoyl-L-alanine amidase